MKAIIYSKDQCPYCDKAKALLTIRKIEFTESKIGRDVTREEFIEMYPDQKTVPLIFIDGNKVGGFNELEKYLSR